MEAEKSHDVLSARRRTRNATGVIQSKYEVLGIQGPMVQSLSQSKSLRIRSADVQGQKKDVSSQTERAHSLLGYLFVPQYLGLQGIGWWPLTVVRVISFSPLLQMLISSGDVHRHTQK